MHDFKTGSFRAVFAVSEKDAEQFILGLRARLARHGVQVDITRWECNSSRSYPGLSIWLPREHYRLIRSILTLMFQNGEIESCFLVPQVEMRRICGYRMIETYHAQSGQKVLTHAATGQQHWTPVMSLIEAEDQYRKNGRVVNDVVLAGLGMKK